MNWFIPFIFIYICLIINVYFVYHNLFLKFFLSEIKSFSFYSYLFIYLFIISFYFTQMKLRSLLCSLTPSFV